VVSVDPGRCADEGPDGLVAPTGRVDVVIPLGDGPVTIGRRRDGEEPSTIDLSGDHADPGVSRHHATIARDRHGAWQLTDEGSTNGTTVDGDERPVPPHVPVPLGDGSRVHVGAWTTVTLHAGPATAG
jgi:pSer/pThr/pTyr-binding forkhead associated (FHA) protein